ncbi:MAG: GGDEF and EAL domain-containing protein [Bradyrhizobium sp.]|nr:MAG: GGDEF and EAL domain-containing protein [Bradyrhizobium sp.]
MWAEYKAEIRDSWRILLKPDLPSELMLSTVLNALPGGLFWQDRDSRILGCNLQFADDAGADPIDLIGKTIFDLRPSAMADAYRADDLEVINTGRPKLAIEEPLLLSNGSITWIETDTVPLRDAAGEIVGVLGTYRDISERRRIDDERFRLAIELAAVRRAAMTSMHDALTGLPNRHSLKEKLRNLLATSIKPEERCAVVAIDLDRLKTVNDLYGEAVGDELLRNVAGILSDLAGAREFVARVGGDEFVLALTFESEAVVYRRLGDLISIFERPLMLAEHQVAISVSLGVATTPADGADPDLLVLRADMALNSAKAQGCGRAVRFEPEMERDARDRALLERDLKIAIRADEIVPHFQPIIDLRTGSVVCYEILARWSHDERGQIPPQRFIKIATDTGLIGALTINLLRRACREIAMHCSGAPRIAINIAPVQLRDVTLPQKLLKVLSDCQFPPERLEIEITEDAIVSDVTMAKNILGSLKSVGVRVALDDFGIGYSSLQYLSELPFDALKIDQSFVKSMTDSTNALMIVKSILQIAKNLDLEVIAEGIETQEQALLLRTLGCELGQGFYLGRPSPAFSIANNRDAEEMENSGPLATIAPCSTRRTASPKVRSR